MFDSNQLSKIKASVKVTKEKVSFYLHGTNVFLSDSKRASEQSEVIIDHASVNKEGSKNILSMGGWAADIEYRLPMKSILVIQNGKVISLIKRTNPRPDVAAHLSSFVDGFGFSLKCPYSENDELLICFIRPSNICDVRKLSVDSGEYKLSPVY